MKTLAKILSIICFVLLLTSCEKDREKIQINSFSETSTNLKGEDDADIIFAEVPTIHEHLFLTSQQLAAGVNVNLVGVDVTYDVSTTLDQNACFTFYNVPSGTLKRKVYIGGVLENTITYIVQY